MKGALFIISFILLNFNVSTTLKKETCISEKEKELAQLINEYRRSKSLHDIPISQALTQVAQAHAEDLYYNYTLNDSCNPHSWSAKGQWEPCCYTDDHKNAECMWSKPNEISEYGAYGYEILYWHSSDVNPKQALKSWEKSKSHNPVIVNQGIWKDVKWQAMGVGIFKNYAVVWFGQKEDDVKPKYCIKKY